MVFILEDTFSYTSPPLHALPDEESDKPTPGTQLHTVGVQDLSYLIFGAGTFANQYNKDEFLNSDGPLRTLRLALRYGIRAIDTSPYYGHSEIILGALLRNLASEFPRTSYKLMTKAGRYGTSRALFDYTPSTVRASVLRSLARLGTDHLDVAYMHDVEFVATPVVDGSTAGEHLQALADDPGSWGLGEEDKARIRGEGDRQVLDAIRELWKLKGEGKVKAVGISGYPLPTLLRLAILVLYNPPYKPLDIVLSYSHYTLQNTVFAAYLPQFVGRAKVAQLATASPLSMGLLTQTPPAWHPASPEIIAAKERAVAVCGEWEGGLPNVALGFALREGEGGMRSVPRVVGLSTVREVHEAVKVWREVHDHEDERRRRKEEEVRQMFRENACENVSWQSPPL